MKKTVVTNLPAGEIVEIRKLENGTFEVVQNVTVSDEVSGTFDDDLILIEAENLSVEDKFMRYVPRTHEENILKNLIIQAINQKVRNFYCPKYDPSFSDDNAGIVYRGGNKPAVDKSYMWWSEVSRNTGSFVWVSSLGTRWEYVAFLGVLIKKMVEAGRSVQWAWDVVCNDSIAIGNYKTARQRFEFTGSEGICGFCDLANTYKILAGDQHDGSFWVASGCYRDDSFKAPIAHMRKVYNHAYEPEPYAVGWIVFYKKC